VSVEPARPKDYPLIAELTVSVYVGGGLSLPDYTAELADVSGRAQLSELLVARDTGGQSWCTPSTSEPEVRSRRRWR
jgi:hypothetical protein